MSRLPELFKEAIRHWDDFLSLVKQVIDSLEPPEPPRPIQPLRVVGLDPLPIRSIQQILQQAVLDSGLPDRILAGRDGAVTLALRLEATASQILEVICPIVAFLLILRLVEYGRLPVPPVQNRSGLQLLLCDRADFVKVGFVYVSPMSKRIHEARHPYRGDALKLFAATAALPFRRFTADEDDRIKYAASSMQGLCSHMENARSTILDLDGTKSTSFFGVYDGHGGANVAHHCVSQFHTELKQDEDYQNNLDNAVRHMFFRMDEQLKELDEFRAPTNPPHFSFNLLRPLKTAASVKAKCSYVLVDHYILAVITYHIPRIKGPGSTACVAVIRGHQIIVGNVGDSRCVLSRGRRAMALSTDHKPNLPGECERIQNAGGRVTKPYRFAGRVQSSSYRVNGSLAMSRAIGDFQFKSNTNLGDTEQMVTCNPDVCTVDITEILIFFL